jgi:hypothetical protein
LSIEPEDGGFPSFNLMVMDGGADSHMAMGYMRIPTGQEVQVHGTVTGIRFSPRPRQGRPKEDAKRIAVMLAHDWFVSQGVKATQAKEEVVNLWESKKFKGISDSAHVRTKLREAKALLPKKGHVLSFIDQEIAEHSGAWFIERVHFLHESPDSYEMVFNGWAWQVGMEFAVHGLLKVSAKGKFTEEARAPLRELT